MENVGFLALVVAFTLPPLIRPGFAGAPSPSGEGFGAGELGGWSGEPTWSAGACPRPTKGTFTLPKLLSRIEPGDPLRWWSIARVTGSNCQRPLAASPRGRAEWGRSVLGRFFLFPGICGLQNGGRFGIMGSRKFIGGERIRLCTI